jgi:hypothetical protein
MRERNIMSEDIDWSDPSFVIKGISEVIWPPEINQDYDIFDDVEHIGWMIDKHYQALKNQ